MLLSSHWTSPWMWGRMPKIRTALSSIYRKRFATFFQNDLKVWVSLTDHIESQLFWQGVQEGDRGEVALLKKLLEPNHVFFDIGANIGAFSLVASKLLPQGTVHAFEPSAFHLEKLTANLRLNHAQNVVIHPVALSDTQRSTSLYFPLQEDGLENTGMASQFPFNEANSKVETIDSVILDDYIEEWNCHKINIMKIDVEGAELKVLQGSLKAIQSNRPHVLMEVNLMHLNRAGCRPEQLIQFWHTLDYQIFIIGNTAELTPVVSMSDLGAHQNVYCRPAELPSNGLALQ